MRKTLQKTRTYKTMQKRNKNIKPKTKKKNHSLDKVDQQKEVEFNKKISKAKKILDNLEKFG